MVPVPTCFSCQSTTTALLDVQTLQFTHKCVYYSFKEVLTFCLSGSAKSQHLIESDWICEACSQHYQNVYILRKRLFHRDSDEIKDEPEEIDIKLEPDHLEVTVEPVVIVDVLGQPTSAECVFCPAKFGTEQALGQHVDIEHEFENPGRPDVHDFLQEINYTPVTSVPVFKCSSCPVQFAAFYEFKVHVFMAHKLKQRLIFCNVCHSPFPTMRSMLVHRQEHPAFREATDHDNVSLAGRDQYQMKTQYLDHQSSNVIEPSSPTVGCIWCGSVFEELDTLKKHFISNNCSAIWPKNAGLEMLALWKKSTEATADKFCVQCNLSKTLLLHIFSRTFVCESGATISMQKAYRISTGRVSTPNMMLCDACETQIQLNYERLIIDKVDEKEILKKAPIKWLNTRNLKPPHKCRQCSKRFEEFVKFKEHMWDKHNETIDVLACEICSQIFFNLQDLCHHEKAKHGLQIQSENMEFCVFCSTSFADEVALKRHTFVDHPGQPCPYCEKTFTARNLRVSHIEKSHAFCKICQVSFGDQESYEQHRQIHLECPYCKKRFPTLQCIRKHIASVHRGQVTDFLVPTKPKVEDEPTVDMLVCDFCAAEYSTRKEMAKHMILHRSDSDPTLALLASLQGYKPTGPDERFKCPVCEKEYQLKEKFRKHLYWHRAHKVQLKNTYLCLFCARSFKSKNSLDYHTRHQHTDVKPKKTPKVIFKREACKLCHKVILKVSMRDHMQKIHKIGFDYACRLCKQTFESVEIMWKHYAAEHTAAQTTCEVCHRRFKTWELKFQHSFDHRGFKPFVCPKMDCYFKTKYVKQHRIHLKKRHDIDYDERIHGYREADAERIKALQESKILPADGHDPYAKKHEFQCSQCYHSYEKETSLQRHFAKMHGKSSRTYVCTQCDYTHKDRLSAYHHCFNHLGYKPYQCFVGNCTVGTKVKKLYMVHLKKHHNIDYNEAEHGFKGNINDIMSKIFK